MQDGLRLFGVTLIGATGENLRKLALTVAFIIIAYVVAVAGADGPLPFARPRDARDQRHDEPRTPCRAE
jgi:hypothetical protein